MKSIIILTVQRIITGLVMMILLIGINPTQIPLTKASAGSVSWVEVPQTKDGRQWWDEGSLKATKDGFINVLTRYSPATNEKDNAKGSRIYLMQIDCGQMLFKDISVNGLPRFNAVWLSSGGDALIDSVMSEVCKNVAV